ncbi:Alpha/Beta hydrolase protein [Trametes punicea]|nr:Alpha/Beta hydrolase protein [Trametes punicea]
MSTAVATSLSPPVTPGKDSLSDPTPPSSKPAQPAHFPRVVEHAPRAPTPSRGGCRVEKLQIKVEDVPDGTFVAFLHCPIDYPPPEVDTRARRVGAILLSGAGGGVTGPSGIYLSIGDKLASLPDGQAIPTLRMDYRYPARNRYCVPDVLSAMDWLQTRSDLKLTHFVLVGWSFGGAPVFTVGGADERVIGAATVASQTAETDGITKMSPRAPVLLIHGTGDRTLSPRCSQALYDMYGDHPRGRRTLKLFPGDDHALTRNSKTADKMICEFIMECAGGQTQGDRVRAQIAADLGPDSVEEKKDTMQKGCDLKGPEHLE